MIQHVERSQHVQRFQRFTRKPFVAAPTPSTTTTTTTAAAAVVTPMIVDPAVLSSVRSQMREEIGGSELTASESQQLLQKFGLMAPQLTHGENNAIRRESHRGGSKQSGKRGRFAA